HRRISQSSYYTHDAPPSEICTLSLHDALPISIAAGGGLLWRRNWRYWVTVPVLLLAGLMLPMLVLAWIPRAGNFSLEFVSFTLRSEEHTSELQSLRHLVCRLLLEKKNTCFVVR